MKLNINFSSAAKLLMSFVYQYLILNHGIAVSENIDSLQLAPAAPTSVSSGIPSSFINLGGQDPTYAIVVEKLFHKLSVFKLLPDGLYSVEKTYLAITGKEQGDKQFQGDNKTPEGIYFIVGQKKSVELSRKLGAAAKKYGPLAFVLDYPNIFDERKRKTGSGIWIHGVDSDLRILRPFDTEGCVALKNDDILDISKYVSEFQTPIVIVDKMESLPAEKLHTKRQQAFEILENWRKSWQSSDFEKYNSFYSKDFRSLGLNKNRWLKFKSNLSAQRKSSIEISLGEPKILEFKNDLLIEFVQKYSSSVKKDYGIKFLYLKKEEDTYKIIAEKWYALPENKSELAVIQSPTPRQN